MNKLAVFAVAFAALAITAGCGFKESDLVGKWKGKMVLSAEDKKEAGAEAAKAEGLSFDLVLNEDKTFVLAVGVSTEGTWTYADNKLTLTTTKVMGMDVSGMPGAAETKPQVLNVEDGGNKLVLADPNGKSTTVVAFTKVKEE